MRMVQGRIVVVAGGTGNVGTHIVRSLLDHDGTVVVPSRSKQKLDDLHSHLSSHVGPSRLSRLVPLVGNI